MRDELGVEFVLITGEVTPLKRQVHPKCHKCAYNTTKSDDRKATNSQVCVGSALYLRSACVSFSETSNDELQSSRLRQQVQG